MSPRAAEEPSLLERLQDRMEAEPERRNLPELLEGVRAEDVAEVLGDFTPEEKLAVFLAVPKELQAEVLDETDDNSRRELLEQLPVASVGDLLQAMPPDEATDLLGLVPEEKQPSLLERLDTETADDLRQLQQHDPESAGGIMTPDYITVSPDQRAREVLEILQRSLDTEVVSYVYVVNESEELVGVISIREIIAASPEDRVRDFMTPEVISVQVDDDQEEVANCARKYNLHSIPVVDSRRRLVGVATIDDIVDVISDEADEDIYLMAGTAGDHPVQQRILRRALVRIPWLLFPAASGFLVAYFTGQSEGLSPEAQESIILVAFVPLVMGICGGVGTQSSTIMARGIATGEIDPPRMVRVFSQEMTIGLAIAFSLGLLVMLTLYVGIESGVIASAPSMLPTAVGTGLITGIILATFAGTLFPMVCHGVGLDPALVAGPFVTALNDVVAALSYLLIGHVLLK